MSKKYTYLGKEEKVDVEALREKLACMMKEGRSPNAIRKSLSESELVTLAVLTGAS